MSNTMQAAWYERTGPAREVLTVGKLPMPDVRTGEVLVHVGFSGVNPSDTRKRSSAPMTFPRVIPHSDGSGVIEAVGAGVDPARVGERVWTWNAQFERAFGTAAKHVALPAEQAVRLPDGVELAAGACLGIPALTAHRCVFADGPVNGSTILVTGGGGAVGQYAVGLAKWGGATVIATAGRPETVTLAKAAGADHVLDHRADDLSSRILELTRGAGVERIVEVAFGPNLPTSAAVLKRNGVIAVYASDGDWDPVVPVRTLLLRDITVHFVLVYIITVQARQAAIADVTACLEAGVLRHPIGLTLPLADIAAAHEAMERGDVAGKILVELG